MLAVCAPERLLCLHKMSQRLIRAGLWLHLMQNLQVLRMTEQASYFVQL